MISVNLKRSLQFPGGTHLLDIGFEIPEASTLAIMGPSGSGKTSLLRMVAGLMKPDEGKIVVKGETWLDEKMNLPPQKREVGFVFQDYALFPHMTVEENLRFALPSSSSRQFIHEMLTWMRLEALKGQKPLHLSGGQQQRVALARALIRKPRLLLLDEPLAALDHVLRSDLQNELNSLQEKLGFSMILVSHDPMEVVKMSNQVMVLHNGKIDKMGTPASILAQPAQTNKVGKVIEVFPDKNEIAVLTEREILLFPMPSTDIKVGDSIQWEYGSLRILPSE